MRTLALPCVLLLLLATGCTRFGGEWLEEGIVRPDGQFEPTQGRKTALRFDWPSQMRYGSYHDRAGVVDASTVQYDTYWTMQWDRVAQAGQVTARVEGERLTAVVSGDTAKRYVKVRGPSIFPPLVKLPALPSQ